MCVLIGSMGAGKSTIGRLLAARLGFDFIDSDDAIIEKAGKSIPRIFEEDGECIFRALESEVLQELCSKHDRQVLATGGGAVLRALNRERIINAGYVIWLDAQPEVLAERIMGDKNRPLLHGVDVLSKAKQLDRERRKYYDMCADIRVDTSLMNAKEAVDTIIVGMEKRKRIVKDMKDE
jgi:shikimate kinase